MRTSLASGLATTSLVFLIAAMFLLSWHLVLLSLPPAIILAVGALFPPSVPKLAAVRSVSRERAPAGMPVEVELSIHNVGPALDLLEVVDVVPRELALAGGTNHTIAGLASDGTLRLHYVVRPTIKGDFRIGPVRVRSLDPLGLGAEDASLPVESRIVYAVAYAWCWDLEATGLPKADYREILIRHLATFGFREVWTDDPDVLFDPLSIMLVRVGARVPPDARRAFERRLVEGRGAWMEELATLSVTGR